MEANEYAEWENRHECVFCRDGIGTVSFCENCNRDHHNDGYETCKRIGLPPLTNEQINTQLLEACKKAAALLDRLVKREVVAHTPEREMLGHAIEEARKTKERQTTGATNNE